MKITELLLAELEREAVGIRKTMERVPEGKNDWKPHEKSMPLGYLATIVATIPSWLDMVVNMDELDINPPGGGSAIKRTPLHTVADYLGAHDKAVADARAALQGASEEHLMKPWRLLVAGKVVSETPRHEMVQDTFNHLAHHRGQMTVYLRLLGAKVPSTYGPSADDKTFA